jgi:hypothetical protein
MNERNFTFKASNVKGDKCVEFKLSFLNIFIPKKYPIENRSIDSILKLTC